MYYYYFVGVFLKSNTKFVGSSTETYRGRSGADFSARRTELRTSRNDGDRGAEKWSPLTAVVRDGPSDASQFSDERWDGIAAGSAASYVGADYDDVKTAGKVVDDIYDYTATLLLKNVDGWSRSPQTAGVYEKETADLINVAITELVAYRRRVDRGKIDRGKIGRAFTLEKLLALFYFSERKRDGGEQPTAQWFLEQFPRQPPEMLDDSGTDELVADLTQSLSSVEPKTDLSFHVSPAAMKIRILAVDPTAAEAVAARDVLEKLRNVRPAGTKTLREYATSYQSEYDGGRIEEYHWRTLGAVMTHVFGYVYNHFELRSKLLASHSRGDNARPESADEKLSAFMDGYVSVLVYRYFEFRGEINERLADAMVSVASFLKDRRPGGEPPGAAADPPGTGRGDPAVRSMIDRAVDELLRETLTADRRAAWNASTRIDWDGRRDDDGGAVSRLMDENADRAVEILAAFSCQFSPGETACDRLKTRGPDGR